ncbi:hypothetical protein F4780DRAFT_407868 [Xylariomycetidae sp. FL0641]|nr:hypothetical protein F4780DRAFT_407868 [Xylariomycetidae sp. FL0641]
MSSLNRLWLPLGFAVTFGVINATYAFKPALEEYQQQQHQQSTEHSSSPESMQPTTDSTQSKSGNSASKLQT